MDRHVGRDAPSAARAIDPEEVRGTPQIDREIGVEDRGNENRAAHVRLEQLAQGIRLGRRPERRTQAAVHASRLAELLSQFDERIPTAHLRSDERLVPGSHRAWLARDRFLTAVPLAGAVAASGRRW